MAGVDWTPGDPCPTCGAHDDPVLGVQLCTTNSGRDHKTRWAGPIAYRRAQNAKRTTTTKEKPMSTDSTPPANSTPTVGMAALRATENTAEVGHCKHCGQELIRTATDCWHPHSVPVICPPEVATEENPVIHVEWGDGFGRPGRDAWLPGKPTPAWNETAATAFSEPDPQLCEQLIAPATTCGQPVFEDGEKCAEHELRSVRGLLRWTQDRNQEWLRAHKLNHATILDLEDVVDRVRGLLARSYGGHPIDPAVLRGIIDAERTPVDGHVLVRLPVEDVAFIRGFDPDRDRTATRADMVTVIEHLQAALTTTPEGADQ